MYFPCSLPQFYKDKFEFKQLTKTGSLIRGQGSKFPTNSAIAYCIPKMSIAGINIISKLFVFAFVFYCFIFGVQKATKCATSI